MLVQQLREDCRPLGDLADELAHDGKAGPVFSCDILLELLVDEDAGEDPKLLLQRERSPPQRALPFAWWHIL